MVRPLGWLSFVLVVFFYSPAAAQQISCQGSCRIICYSFDPLDGSTSTEPIVKVGEPNNDKKETIRRVVNVGLNSFIVYWDDNTPSYFGFPPTVSCRVHSNSAGHETRR